jgi:hypothetical protein
MILDEFVKVTGYHRKHAIRVLTAQVDTQRERSVGHRIYREAVKEALIVLWEASDRICGKRLKAFMSAGAKLGHSAPRERCSTAE